MEKILRETLIDGKFGNVSPTRSRMMQAIKGKGNKTTELKFCHALRVSHIKGWVLHAKIPGNPDIFFPDYQLAIFLDGCFWHGCKKCGHIPTTNNAYWKTKIEKTIQRDLQKATLLREQGHLVLRFWEHDIEENLKQCISILKLTLDDALEKKLYYFFE